MSNPSTPPQAVRGIVHKCVMPHECESAHAEKLEESVQDYVRVASLLARFLAKWKREAKQLTSGTLHGLTPQ